MPKSRSASEDATSRGGRWTKIAVAIVALAAVAFLLRQLGPQVTPYVTDFLDWVDSLGFWAPVVYILGYAAATVAFVPGSILTMAGGVLFGIALGTAYVFVAATLGACLAFLVARYVARGAIERRLEGNDRFRLIDEAIGEDGLKLVVLLRLVPFFPFVWLNYGLGLTRVRFRDFALGSFGMLPGTLLYVYYGKAIGSLAALAGDAEVEHGAGYWTVLGLGLAAAIAVTTLVTRRARQALAEATADVEVEGETGADLVRGDGGNDESSDESKDEASDEETKR